jgi:hypothetical protein
MKMNFSVLEKQKNMNYNMNNYLDVKRIIPIQVLRGSYAL